MENLYICMQYLQYSYTTCIEVKAYFKEYRSRKVHMALIE